MPKIVTNNTSKKLVIWVTSKQSNPAWLYIFFLSLHFFSLLLSQGAILALTPSSMHIFYILFSRPIISQYKHHVFCKHDFSMQSCFNCNTTLSWHPDMLTCLPCPLPTLHGCLTITPQWNNFHAYPLVSANFSANGIISLWHHNFASTSPPITHHLFFIFTR